MKIDVNETCTNEYLMKEEIHVKLLREYSEMREVRVMRLIAGNEDVIAIDILHRRIYHCQLDLTIHNMIFHLNH
ncbi:CLUMA_CG005882, isoform A [Clunio marinus]|uniref:CLUMA_CG005882, isoform A n=1 Tax=Clunio marinus TaxID=568069 RepID=A0A1J1HW40_9DIPT|nr:CLUMA_CG005882, isoform A [Clunio marinus]